MGGTCVFSLLSVPCSISGERVADDMLGWAHNGDALAVGAQEAHPRG
jgi:hypothetical protein